MYRIGIVGPGRAGSALGAALRAAGYQLTGVAARSPASVDRAARLLPGVPVRDLAELVAGSDVLILAVPDDEIAAVAAGIDPRPGQFVVHLSGAHGLAVLAAATARGAVPVALHPPMTFTGTPADGARVRATTFTATAPDEAAALVERLGKELGAGVQWVAEEDRALYHAGLVHGANHLVTLYVQAFDVLRAAGVDDPRALLAPLMRAMLDNTVQAGHDALTGPIARGDVETVRAHLAGLTGSSARSSYVVLARATVELVAADGRLEPGTAARLRAVLDSEEQR
jgi:predicted short-subunit dehydrogenase-like oxidoreductase (DUF2520 family)